MLCPLSLKWTYVNHNFHKHNQYLLTFQGTETIIPDDTDQMAAENLMYLAQDISYTEAAELDDQGVECVTEEVITDDWVEPGGQERWIEVFFCLKLLAQK